jgi:anti-sigma factor RsiW
MNPINEDKLHAYVDATLDEAQRLEVEAWLAGHPDDAERVRDWTAQNQAFHDAFDPVLNEPLPLQLVSATRRLRPAGGRLWRAAASLAVLAVTGLAGYGLGLRSAEPGFIAQMPRDAALAHVVFTPEQRHPVEVDAAHADHLVKWLSKRLGTQLAAPDFTAQGFELLGGRLLTGGNGPVAQFMYQSADQRRVTLYVRREAGENRDTGFRHAMENGVEVFYWIDRDMGYALSGGIGHTEMQRLADAAYRQVGR